MFKQDGLGNLFLLLFLTMLSCFISGYHNHNGMFSVIKGFATVYGFFACITVIYPRLRNNPDNLKWILIGLAISSVICVFIFQPGSAHADGVSDRKALQEAVMGYELFWVQQINTWATLPIKTAFLRLPLWYALVTPLVVSVFALVSTASGRSAFMVGMFGLLLLYSATKTKMDLRDMRRKFPRLVTYLLVCGIVFLMYINIQQSKDFLARRLKQNMKSRFVAAIAGKEFLRFSWGDEWNFSLALQPA